MHNVLAHAGVAASWQPSSAPPSSRTTVEVADKQCQAVADQLRRKVSKLAALMDEAEADVLAA
jgi:putative transposase